jgi:hypothetical protein
VLSQTLIRKKPFSAFTALNANSIEVIPDKSVSPFILLPEKISRAL